MIDVLSGLVKGGLVVMFLSACAAVLAGGLFAFVYVCALAWRLGATP